MMEEKLKQLMKDTLYLHHVKIPVIDTGYPNVFPCITYHFYNESGALFGSGTATEDGASCQIDIWYKEKDENIKIVINVIKQMVREEKYYSYPTMETTYETNAKLFHTHINFELIESEE